MTAADLDLIRLCVKHLDAPDFQWTVSLDLDSVHLDWQALSSIGSLRNLTVLRFQECHLDGEPLQCDSVFARRLSQHACEAELFAQLRCIVWDGPPSFLHIASPLSFLRLLPSLKLVGFNAIRRSFEPRRAPEESLETGDGWSKVNLSVVYGTTYTEEEYVVSGPAC